MANQVFSIVELQRTADGSAVDTPSRFEWTASARSAPRDEWTYSIATKTIREDYPGATQPTEQVLNAHYAPFTLHGVWDDRWNDQGFAESEADRFEALVLRVPLVRIQFERRAFVGLITGGEITFRRRWQIGWQLTFSPHYRVSAGAVVRQPNVVPAAKATPSQRVNDMSARYAALAAIHSASPRMYITADSFALVDQAIAKLGAILDVAASITAQRVLTISDRPDGVSSIKRMSSAMNDAKNAAIAVFQQVQSYKSDTGVAFSDPVNQVAFDAWAKGVGSAARGIAFQAAQGAAELAGRAQGDVLAFYRPTAGESLYAIAQRFYGSPFQWRTIQARNGLHALLLDGTEELIIPKIGAGSVGA